MHYFLGLFYLCGPSTLNAIRRPNQSLVSIWALELRFFLLRLVLSYETEETETVQNDETDMIHKLSNTEHRAHDPQIKQHRA